MQVRQYWRGLALLGAFLCLVLGQSIAQEEHSEGDFQLEYVLGRGAVQDISISPDGHTLAVGSARGVWLYSFPEMDDLDFLPQEGGVGMVSWAPDGERLALGKSGAQVTIWEPGSGKLDHIEQFAVRNIVWSPDGITWRLVAGIICTFIRRTAWNRPSRCQLAPTSWELSGHRMGGISARHWLMARFKSGRPARAKEPRIGRSEIRLMGSLMI